MVENYRHLYVVTEIEDGKFLPVGEEVFTAIIHTDDGYVTILVDEEGYTKAQSKALEKGEAIKIFINKNLL